MGTDQAANMGQVPNFILAERDTAPQRAPAAQIERFHLVLMTLAVPGIPHSFTILRSVVGRFLDPFIALVHRPTITQLY